MFLFLTIDRNGERINSCTNVSTQVQTGTGVTCIVYNDCISKSPVKLCTTDSVVMVGLEMRTKQIQGAMIKNLHHSYKMLPIISGISLKVYNSRYIYGVLCIPPPLLCYHGGI